MAQNVTDYGVLLHQGLLLSSNCFVASIAVKTWAKLRAFELVAVTTEANEHRFEMTCDIHSEVWARTGKRVLS